MKKAPIKKGLAIAKKLYAEYNTINGRVNDINYGGCGIFAEHLYLTLIKLKIKAELVVICPKAEAMDQRILTGQRSWGADAIGHILVRVDNKLFDSEGVYSSHKKVGTYYQSGYSELSEKLTLPVLKKWNGNPNQWNYRFNRKDIPVIKKEFKEAYIKINTNLVVSE